MNKITKFLLSIVLCQLAGIIGGFFTTPQINGWYANLNKPEFTPPGYVIGGVWTILYFLMGISLYLVWEKNWEIKLPNLGSAHKIWNPISRKLLFGEWRKANVILIFSAQLLLNIFWSFIFFIRQSPGAAFFELLMLWVAIAYTIANFVRISKLAAYLLIPYLLWVTFAGYLNFKIWMMN